MGGGPILLVVPAGLERLAAALVEQMEGNHCSLLSGTDPSTGGDNQNERI